ncbi:MAG: APC family permease [Actinomycetes bacterium]
MPENVAQIWNTSKRVLVGTPVASLRMGETLLSKRLALPVFCSDPLSSNAYAPEEIMLVLGLGGMALLGLTPWVAAAVAILLIVVVASYRQTIRAYPSGGGAYAVSRDTLGVNAALVAAGALLIDYVMTVAVSVVAGVANIVSAFPALGDYAVPLSIALVVLLAVVNLRGLRESGTVFAIPTYGFIASMLLVLVVGAIRVATGNPPVSESASIGIAAPAEQLAGAAVVILVLRSFASGCTALTGVEAVSNGIPNFRPPKSDNAAKTITVMGAITLVIFAGLTALAMISQVHVADTPEHLVGAPAGYEQKTVIAQVAASVLGTGWAFLIVQAFTAAILVMAANTAFNGFPMLASLLGHDGFLPRQFGRRGDRLVFSNGILVLAAAAAALIWIFDASTTKLIQLYILGVFVSFTLSQWGMVRNWTRQIAHSRSAKERWAMYRGRLISGFGAAMTALVLIIVLMSKFTHGAWIVVLALPLLFMMMKAISRHYEVVESEVTPPAGGVTLPSRVHAVVLVSKMNAPAMRALAYARATRPSTLNAVTVQIETGDSRELQEEWANRALQVPLTVLDSPYRDITKPLVDFVNGIRRRSPRDLVIVFIPEYVVVHWWQQFLHNQSALRLKTRLLFTPGVIVTSVPWQIGQNRADSKGTGVAMVSGLSPGHQSSAAAAVSVGEDQ